ncbi:MAG: rod-binding protein [Thermodesulfobacteriota bacterium]|nr:rod-binding protein [Thermodesulfobacteriota bacterium]
MTVNNSTSVATHLNAASLNRIVGRSAVASKLQRDIAAVRQASDTRFAVANQSDGNGGDDDRLKKACVDFEAVLMNMMFQAMQKTVPRDGIFGDSLQQDIFNSMYYQKLAQGGAEGDGMGLAAALYGQLSPDEAA